MQKCEQKYFSRMSYWAETKLKATIRICISLFDSIQFSAKPKKLTGFNISCDTEKSWNIIMNQEVFL